MLAQSGQIELSAVCPLLGVKRTYIGEHQSPKSGSRCRTVAMPGLLIEELKAWRATQAQEPIAPRHSPRSRHSHLTPNMQADAAARLDVALRAAKLTSPENDSTRSRPALWAHQEIDP